MNCKPSFLNVLLISNFFHHSPHTDQKEPHSGPERVFSPVYEVRPGATECGSARLDSNSPLLTSPYFTPIPPCCLLPLSSPHTLSPLYPSPPPPTPTSYQTHSSYLTEMVVTYPTLQFHSLTPLIFSLFFLDSPQHLPLVFSCLFEADVIIGHCWRPIAKDQRTIRSYTEDS